MADPRRILRLQQLMLETMATALQQQVEDPRVKGVTITRVKLAKDLTTGVVYWSNLEPGGPRRTAERGLTDVVPFLQALVAEALATRQTPRLTLRFDENMERAARLGDVFAKLARERGELPDPAVPLAEVADEDEGDEDEDEDDDGDDTDKPTGRSKRKDDETDAGDPDVEGDDPGPEADPDDEDDDD